MRFSRLSHFCNPRKKKKKKEQKGVSKSCGTDERSIHPFLFSKCRVATLQTYAMSLSVNKYIDKLIIFQVALFFAYVSRNW